MNQLRVGLVGLGTVGGAVWRHLQTNADLLRDRIGANIVISRVAVRRPERAAELNVPKDRVSTDWKQLVTDPELDVIVELIGGTTVAYDVCRAALENGKHVVTANKALLAEKGRELFELAAKHQRQLMFEASVAGGIPLIKSLREGLVANRILALHGIINGTCNYILWRMSQGNLEFAEALAEAKAGGYAEADESLDVDGHDAAHKATVLAALACGLWIPTASLYVEGIRTVEKRDMAFARKLGYELKLLAIIKADADHAVEVRVQPTLVPLAHVLASVSSVFNAVMVRGDIVGDTLFYGRGAGADATSSAVLGDLADIAAHHPGSIPLRPVGSQVAARIKGIDEIVSRYYLRIDVLDQPGVLAQIAGILGSRQISISSAIQPENRRDSHVPLIFMVHNAKEKEFQAALKEIAALPVVKGPPVRWRVEDFA